MSTARSSPTYAPRPGNCCTPSTNHRRPDSTDGICTALPVGPDASQAVFLLTGTLLIAALQARYARDHRADPAVRAYAIIEDIRVRPPFAPGFAVAKAAI